MSGKIKPWPTGHWFCQLVYPQNPWLLVRRQLTTCYCDAYGRCLHPSKKWNEGQYHVSLYECFAETYGESFSVLCMISRNKRTSQCDGFWAFVRKDSGIDNIEALSISIQSLSGLFRRGQGANLSFLKIHKWAWWEVVHLIHVQMYLNHVVQLLPHIYVCNFCLYRYILISFCGHRQLIHSLAWPIALTTNKLNVKDSNRWDGTEGTLQKDWHS